MLAYQRGVPPSGTGSPGHDPAGGAGGDANPAAHAGQTRWCPPSRSLRGDDLRARGVRFVQDALREVPGAAVVQAGSFGGVSSLFLRGGESDYVKVLIDGVPVNQSGGAFNWANLTTDNVDRIEVLRGPAACIYGSDAVTGVVQIFTRRGEAGFSVEGGAEAGTFGTVERTRAASWAAPPRLTYSADASRFATDGTYQFNNDYGNTALSGSVRGLPDAANRRLAFRPLHRQPISLSRLTSPACWPTAISPTPRRCSPSPADVGRRLGDRYDLRLTAGGNRTDGEFDDRPDNAADTLGFGFASQRDSRAERGNLDARINGTAEPGADGHRRSAGGAGDRAAVGRDHLELRRDRDHSRHAVRPGPHHLRVLRPGCARPGFGSGAQPQRAGGRQQRVRHLLHLSRRERSIACLHGREFAPRWGGHSRRRPSASSSATPLSWWATRPCSPSAPPAGRPVSSRTGSTAGSRSGPPISISASMT